MDPQLMQQNENLQKLIVEDNLNFDINVKVQIPLITSCSEIRIYIPNIVALIVDSGLGKENNLNIQLRATLGERTFYLLNGIF